jgi:hypothetical protein
MHSTYTSNLVLWGVQGFLALFFLSACAPKLLGRGLVASVHVPPGTIGAALAVLVPAAIVNIAILVARPARTAAAASVGIRE